LANAPFRDTPTPLAVMLVTTYGLMFGAARP
jgi:hypothetical protein